MKKEDKNLEFKGTLHLILLLVWLFALIFLGYNTCQLHKANDKAEEYLKHWGGQKTTEEILKDD